jgi:hypothetical protein
VSTGAVPTPEPASTRSKVPRELINLILLWLLGTGVSVWLCLFTDWFEKFLVIIGGGSLLAWPVVLSKIIPERRLEAWHAVIYAKVFRSGVVTFLLAMLLAMGGLASSLFTAIEVRSIYDLKDRTVRIGSKPAIIETTVKQGESVRQILGPKLGGGDYRVKIAGYPEITARPRPWRRANVRIPTDVRRPAILLRPSTSVIDRARSSPRKLHIKAEAGEAIVNNFQGNGVWIGCEGDVDVPDVLVQRWKASIVSEEAAQAYSVFWTDTKESTPILPLRAGETITVRQVRRDGTATPEVLITVKDPELGGEPQVEDYADF